MRRMMTVAALLALSLSARAADVHVGINIGVPPPPPPIVVETPPPLVVVPRTPVYYAPDVPYNFFYYEGLYYVFHDGYWFSATTSRGPWAYVRHVPRPVLAVPVRYYKVPPGHAKRHGPPPWAGHGRGHGHGHGHGHGKHED
jgi:hypothetical protein